MAYMSQENKKKLVELCKPILKKHGVKATFAVRHNSTIVCNIRSGKIDFFKNLLADNFGRQYIDVNVYHYHDHFEGDAKDFLTELIPVLYTGNWDNSDAMTDYFDVGWYVDVNIGNWNKPYELTA